jgi:membrane protein implicated in regulation of membrane protease activity
MELAKSLVLDWYNVVFTASIVFWVLYLFITAIGGSTSDHMDVSHDADPDFHDISHDVHHEVGHGHSLTSNILSFLGVGKCPISIILMLLGVSFGFIGLVCNGFFSTFKLPAILYFWVSAGIALIAAVAFTRACATLIGRYMPRKGSTAIEDLGCLVGLHGETSTIVDKDSGRVKVQDQYGSLHNIYCATVEGDDPIPPNTEVLIVSRLFDGRFQVKKLSTLPVKG